MKVLAVSLNVPHPRGRSGASVVVDGALRALAARHEVTLVTFAPEDAGEAQALDALRASGVEVHAVGGFVPPWAIRLKRRAEHALGGWRDGRGVDMNATDPRFQHLVDRLLDRGRFDLLHVENVGVRTYRYDRAEIPSVVVEHEVGRWLTDGREDSRYGQPAIWRQFDRIQVYTAHDAAGVASVAPELAGRVRVNPFGIDVPAAPPGTNEEEEGTLVFVGRFLHVPNLDAALWLGREIMPRVRELAPGARLLLVGGDPPAAVRELGRDDVVVTGAVPDVEPYLRRAAVALAPLRKGGGMRVKVLQAMALGKAIVATPLAAEGLEAREEPPLEVAADADAFAAAVARLLRERGTRAELGRRARAFVAEHHGWDAYQRRLDDTYAELVEDRSRLRTDLGGGEVATRDA